jgi:hypothetical protein
MTNQHRLPTPFDPITYYNPETHLFPALAQTFADTGELNPAALYLILDWKAPRARTRQLRRLTKIAGSFDEAARGIAMAGTLTKTKFTRSS